MIVTSIDANFLPALKALHNSLLQHSPDTPLACLTYGDEALKDEVEALGIEVHHNLDVTDNLPPGESAPTDCRPVYARLMMPLLYDECIYMDADQIVLGDLTELFELRFSEPVAAVRDPHNTKQSVIGMNVPDSHAVYSGLLVFNVDEWRRLDLTKKCFDLMNNSPDVVFRFADQSVLNVVLNGNFHKLSNKWQGFANRIKTNPRHHNILHWHGREIKPWTHPDSCHADIWWLYAGD